MIFPMFLYMERLCEKLRIVALKSIENWFYVPIISMLYYII